MAKIFRRLSSKKKEVVDNDGAGNRQTSTVPRRHTDTEMMKNIQCLQEQLNEYARSTLPKMGKSDFNSTAISDRGTATACNVLPQDENDILGIPGQRFSGEEVAVKYNSGGSNDAALIAEIAYLKKELKSTKREMMNEIHATRYDVLKEITMLKGAIMKLVNTYDEDCYDNYDESKLMRGSASSAASAQRNSRSSRSSEESVVPAPPYKPGSKPLLNRAVSVETQQSDFSDNSNPKAFPILDALGETKNTLSDEYLDSVLPIAQSSEVIKQITQPPHKGTREWVFSAFQNWIKKSPEDEDKDRVMILTGASGCGKTTVASALCNKFSENIAASHFCQSNRKADSSPVNVVLSFANQLSKNVLEYRHQLARLNLPYLVEETDASVLASKLLIEPLSNMREPENNIALLIDGLDECETYKGDNSLSKLLSECCLEFPTWVVFYITMKSSKKLVKQLPPSTLLKLNTKSAQGAADCRVGIQRILKDKVNDSEYEEAIEILLKKSDGNFMYLDFIEHAFKDNQITNGDGKIPLETVNELPEDLAEIYEDIFDEKYGQGRRRLWKKVKPFLELIVGADLAGKPPVTEGLARDALGLSRDDLKRIKRSFMDLIKTVDGEYLVRHKSVLDFMVSSDKESAFYIDYMEGIDRLNTVKRSSGSSY